MKLRWNKEYPLLSSCALAARIGDWILSKISALLLILLFLFSFYALWDSLQVFHGANLESRILDFKPQEGKADVAENPTIQELVEMYPDARAWLTLYDTNIDYPVVQGEDNGTYVNQSVEGEFSLAGSIFLDFRNAGGFTDMYSIIYGHHMESDTMFGGLDLYKDRAYMVEHSEGILYLPYTTYRIEIFAYCHTDAYDEKIFTPIYADEDMEPLMEYIEKTAGVYREIEWNETDRIIGLSTCSSEGTNARTIVIGRIIEQSAVTEGDVE